MKDNTSFPKWFPQSMRRVLLHWYAGPLSAPILYRVSPMIMTNRIMLKLFLPMLVFYAITLVKLETQGTMWILYTLGVTLVMYGTMVFVFSRIHWYRCKRGFYTEWRTDRHLPEQAFKIALLLAIICAIFPLAGWIILAFSVIGAIGEIF